MFISNKMFTRIMCQKGSGSIRKYEKNPTALKIAKSVERFRVTFRANGKRQTANVRFKGAYHLTEKSGWGVESIMVSDLPVYVEMPHPLGFEFKKRANLCSVSLEPRRNREIG